METLEQGLSTVKSYTSTDSKGITNFVFDNIRWLALAQCFHQPLFVLRTCHFSQKGSGDGREVDVKEDPKSSLDLNTRCG